MKVKLDDNMPRRAGKLLEARGHDVTTVVAEGLGGKKDATVARMAAREGRLIITLDRRFADVRRYLPGRHPGFLVLRPDDQSSENVECLLAALLDQHQLEQMARCLVVVEPGAVRIRRPGER